MLGDDPSGVVNVPSGPSDVETAASVTRALEPDGSDALSAPLDASLAYPLGETIAEDLLVLPENQFALSVLAHVEDFDTGTSSPQVYLYGPAGGGKSNLLRTAAQLLGTRYPAWRILILTAADFAARFTEAADTKAFRAFRKQFQQVDLLIMEDLHALSGRFDPQRQLVAAWDDALAHQCRLLISCRSGIHEVGGMLPEVINRCHGAIQVPLRLPNARSREMLLKHWTRTLTLTPDVIPFVARHFEVSPRELQGVATQLTSLGQTRRGTLDLSLVQKYLLGQHPATSLSSAEIAKSVARHFQVTLSDLRAKSRQPGFVLPRQCAMYLIRELTSASLKTIGEYFGGRDHTTVLHACQKLETLLPEQPGLRQDLAKIRTLLQVFSS